ncbi:YHS domain-containing (seleno)protein [Yoonia sp. SS1-5]|uniref:YHS domain-containing (Seleno)protein n=1 Tax=Yoonia rhodophyticola TaxID=3137370 RepID=A0AAN0NK43_9RHOB
MMTRRHMLALIASTPLMTRPAYAGPSRVYSKNGFAIHGIDPVAYFARGAAVPGSMAHRLVWHGATWLFVDRSHRLTFEMNPKAFAPQYGGYCAMGMARGEVIPSDPEAWMLHDGKLFLNHSAQALSAWSTDVEANMSLANDHWPRLQTG